MGFFNSLLSGIGSAAKSFIGGLPGLALGAGSSLISSMIGRRNSKSALRDQIESQYRLMGYQNQLYRDNIRDSALLQKEGLQKAGISAQFMNGVNASASMPSSSFSAPIVSAESVNAAPGSASLSQIPLNEARAIVEGYNGKIGAIDLEYREKFNQANLSIAQANYDKVVADTAKTWKEADFLKANFNNALRLSIATATHLEADAAYKESQTAGQDISNRILGLQETRDAFMTANFEKSFSLSMAKTSAEIQNLMSMTSLNSSQSAVNRALAGLYNVQTQFGREQVKSLEMQNHIASGSYLVQTSVALTSALLEKQRLDSTYVPTYQEQKLMFQLDKSLKEYSEKEAKFNFDMQGVRKWNNYVGAVRNTIGVVGDVMGIVNPTKNIFAPATRSFKTQSYSESSNTSHNYNYNYKGD